MRTNIIVDEDASDDFPRAGVEWQNRLVRYIVVDCNGFIFHIS